VSDTNIEKPNRRVSDDILTTFSREYILAIHDDIESIKRKLLLLDTAFLRDDLNAIDYSGHRKDHLERKRANTILSEYKISATKVVITIVVTFLVGALSSGFVSKFIEAMVK